MPHHIFISHSSKDKPVADAACAHLESRGLRCWVAPRDIVTGTEWGASIIDGIQGSRAMLLILSSHSNDSPQVRREIERAANRGIPLLPFIIEADVVSNLSKSLEFFLSSAHWFEAHTGPIEQHLERLAGDITRILDGTPSGVDASPGDHDRGTADGPWLPGSLSALLQGRDRIARTAEAPPSVVAAAAPTRADALSLASGDRRIHLIARRRVTCGRSRENDICLRFLPRCPDNDEASRGISRRHMALELGDAGLALIDEWTKGFDVDCDPVGNAVTLTHQDAHVSRQIDLPSRLSSLRTLEMDLTIFGGPPEDSPNGAVPDRDDACLEAIGEPAGRLWQTSRRSGIEAARIRRVNNLSGEEYVMLYRHATVGRSARDHAVVVPAIDAEADDLQVIHAGRMFWLFSGGSLPLVIDDRPIEGRSLAQLAAGQTLRVGSATLQVEQFAQLELDDESSPA